MYPSNPRGNSYVGNTLPALQRSSLLCPRYGGSAYGIPSGYVRNATFVTDPVCSRVVGSQSAALGAVHTNGLLASRFSARPTSFVTAFPPASYPFVQYAVPSSYSKSTECTPKRLKLLPESPSFLCTHITTNWTGPSENFPHGSPINLPASGRAVCRNFEGPCCMAHSAVNSATLVPSHPHTCSLSSSSTVRTILSSSGPWNSVTQNLSNTLPSHIHQHSPLLGKGATTTGPPSDRNTTVKTLSPTPTSNAIDLFLPNGINESNCAISEPNSTRTTIFKHEPRKRKPPSANVSFNLPGVSAPSQVTSGEESISLSAYSIPSCTVTSMGIAIKQPNTSVNLTAVCTKVHESDLPTQELDSTRHPTVEAKSTTCSWKLQSFPSRLPSRSPLNPFHSKRPILPNLTKKPRSLLLPPRSLLVSLASNNQSVFMQPSPNTTSFFQPLGLPHHPASSVALRSSFVTDDRSLLFEGPIQLYLIDPTFTLTPPESFLWRRKFFGKSTPQQLVYTLVYLIHRILGLHTGSQLRHDIDGQLKFVFLADSSTDHTNTKEGCYTGPIKFVNSSVFQSDYRAILMQPQLRLLYWPKNEPTEPDRSEPSEVTILPSQAASTGVPLGISVTTKRDDPLIPGSTQQTHKPPLKFGCLFGHFSANNHECCLTCLHAFYLSKRPKTLYGSRGPKEDAYFLAWHPNPSGHMWFRQRPLGSACLSEILRAISAALYWAAVSPSDLSLFPLNRNSPCGLFDAVNRRARSSFFDVPNVYPEDRSTETEFACAAPLNLVIGECSNAPSNSFDKDVGKAHPTCLDYWPELTERARQSPWQCTDCKVCSVCLNKQLTTELLICDACDKGFHSECHVPKLEEPVDRSLPWVCAECQKEGYSVAIGTMPEGASQQYTIPISKSANNQEESPVKAVGTLSEGSSPDESPHANSQSIAEGKARMPTPQMSDVESTTPSNQYHMGIMKPETGNSPAANSLSSPQARTMEKGSPCKPSMNVVSPIDQSIQSTIPASYELSGGRSWDAAKLAPDVVSAPDSPSSITRAVEDKSNGPESFNSVGTLDVPASRESIQCLIRPLDIRAWTVEHVREWLLEEGFPREAEAFFQQEIDGACLLLMKRMDVLTELGIKLGPGVKIYERIKRLQSRCTSPTMLNA